MMYPKCFDSHAEFKAWKQSAVVAKEWVTPCSDCTALYQERMGTRCQRHEVRVNFSVNAKPERNDDE